MPPTGDASLVRDAGTDAPVCAFDQIICEGRREKVCDGRGGFRTWRDCDRECKDNVGCVNCEPGEGACQGGLATLCDQDRNEVVFACTGPGMTCAADGCKGPCSPTALGASNVGCEFWPTVTANNAANRDAFHFGVLVANPSFEVPARVTVVGLQNTITLQPGQVQSIALPFVPELKGADWQSAFVPVAPLQSVNKLNGASPIVSDQPIVAYQFNTLEAQPATPVDPSTCVSLPDASSPPASCYAYSLDASLLLPAHVLASEYSVASYHAWQQPTNANNSGGIPQGIGDFLAITALEDNTTVSLQLPSGALPWAEGVPLIAGQPSTLSMAKGQVVELFTDGASSANSFSGAKVSVTSKTRVQVITGTACAAVPGSSGVCGHMEDVVLPTKTLGQEYVLIPPGDPTNPTQYSVRIHALSGEHLELDGSAESGGTSVSFDPPQVHATATISAGRALEVSDLSQPVVIKASQPVAIMQFANSRGDYSPTSIDPNRLGGPNQLTAVPTAKYRQQYVFAASPSFRTTYVQIVASTGAWVKLDHESVPAEKFSAIGASGRSFAIRILEQSSNDKAHVIESDKPVGIVVQGVGPYASYLYAGGLDL